MLKTNGVKIKGVGRYAPEIVATNDDYAKIVETNDEWITQRTGIKTRHISNGEPTYYLGAMAAKEAIANAGISAEEIGLILASTCTPDYYTPSTACLVQRELGVSGCPAIDINCACSGFVYAVDMAKRYLAEGDIKYVLVVAAEELSKFVDYTDRSTCILFGDAAAAVVLEKEEDTLFASYTAADGMGAPYLAARALLTYSSVAENPAQETYSIPYGYKLKVKEGDTVSAGDPLTEGSINPGDILAVNGVEAVQNYIITEVQKVYRLQGVDINDKHIEVIVRQMMRKVKIDDSGSSYLLPGSLIDRGEVARLNEEIQAQIDAGDENARLITTVPVLQGITKASSYSDSFLSAASFQETTKALTDAAIRGKTDKLMGLKENVIIGKLIPAGTGMDVYNNVQVVKNESAANHNTAETPLY